MFMSAMVQIFSWGERWNAPFNEAKPSWMEHPSFTELVQLWHVTAKGTLSRLPLVSDLQTLEAN